MSYVKIAVAALVSLVVLCLLFTVGADITYQSQAKYFDNIRSIASIIFGVTGAWLAITYPKALSSADSARQASSENRDRSLAQAREDSDTLIGFVRTMIISIIIIAIALAIPFVKEILSTYQWALDNKVYFRGLLYSLLGVMSVVQLTLLLMTLKNTSQALSELNKSVAEATTRSERDQNRNH